MNFSEIFPTFEIFQGYASDCGVEIAEDFEYYCYNKLLQYYAKTTVAYNTVAEFVRFFMIEYEDETPKYAKQIEYADMINELSPEEFEIVSHGIASTAKNNNALGVDPTSTILEYIGTQDYNKQSVGKITAYLMALDNAKTKYLYAYLEKFNKHFERIYSADSYYFNRRYNNG